MMFKVYGNPTCVRCKVVLNSMKSHNLEYEYEYLDNLSDIEQETLIEGAKLAGKMSLPLILKDGEYFTLQEVIQ